MNDKFIFDIDLPEIDTAKLIEQIRSMEEGQIKQGLVEQGCMFDAIAEQDRRNGFTGTRVLGLVCTCPKCSPRCM